MHSPILKSVLAGIFMVAGTILTATSAPAADEPRYAYGMFKISGYALQDPSRGFCGPQCRIPNPQLNSTYIHSPIFRLPEPGEGVNLWETGKEFCRRARRQLGEGWWKLKGMPDCTDGNLAEYYTADRAAEELQKLYGRAQRESRPDFAFEVFEFADFQPQQVRLFVVRFPGAVPAPVSASAPARTREEPRYAAPSPSPLNTAAPQPESIPVTNSQELAEIATRERLNAEQAGFAAKQQAENAAAKAAFEQATADRTATIARQQAEHQAAVAAVEAERVRREREYEAQMAKWRADVEACNRGETVRCGPQ